MNSDPTKSFSGTGKKEEKDKNCAHAGGIAYLNARVMKGMNTTTGNPQSDRQPIVNISKDGETMTTTEEITKARSRVTSNTPAFHKNRASFFERLTNL